METRVQELLDRQAIGDVLVRYARGIDRLDMELVRSCYHSDARDSHGSFSGTVDEFIAWVEPALIERFESTMHFLGNTVIDLDGDRAHVETYCVAMHRLREQPTDWLAGVRYVDVFERRAGEWRIADRTVVFDWARTAPGGESFEAEYLLGTRDRSDVSYRRS
ncbi:MAG: nuclear transport factor 2 family protein [Actinomycetota bacterium]